MAAPKKRRAASRPVTKKELQDNNPSIADQIESRAVKWKNRAIIITAIGAAIGVIVQGWIWSGLPSVVFDRTLDKAITTVKTEVNTKIDSTKDEVVKNQNIIKGEITGTLGELTKTLNTVAKSQVMSTMDQLDMQVRLGFTQKQSLQGQLAVVNQILDKNKNDPLAQARKMQLEDFIKQNEIYMQDAQQKISRIRNTN